MPINRHFFSPTQYIRIFAIVHLTTFLSVSAYLRSTDPEHYPSRPRHQQFQPHRHPATTNTTRSSNTSSSNPAQTMGPKKENSKKAAGNAKKAEAAAQKQAAVDAKTAAAEDREWSKGAKDNSKKAAAAEKAASAAAKKAEREALLAEEEKSQRATPKGANKKTAEKKSRGTLDLGQLDGDAGGSGQASKALNASGIDNALDALSLTASSNELKIDRHPERRFKAAYKAFEERRLPEIEIEHPGLRKQQRIDIVRKEFEKSEENPFNQAGNVQFDATKEELNAEKERLRAGVEKRLASR
ncbi:hypothetical protein B0A52_06021 [Exophiala mesophila]|uniref:DUF1014 domain protein n=1 Tax=Exophiala mesophila TaxID=212818 RepID=A0A438N534_EXOME|nr:hypothetical protein B0A52_06021 [Exophiala mesophila]